MDIIKTIRAEIDRRYEENRERARYDDYYRGMNDGLDSFESFLDTLQDPKFDLDKLREVAVPLSDEEKEAHRKLMDERRKKYEEMGILQEPEVNLEKEIEKAHKRFPEVSFAKLSRIAKRFYELGKNAK